MRGAASGLFGALLFSACAGAKAPPIIVPPAVIDSFCHDSTAPRATALAAIMTSTDDKLLASNPNASGIVREMRAQTGGIGHWNGQLVALPNVSKALGESDGYARVDAVAVPQAQPGADNRVVYFEVRDHGVTRWIALTAYDVQNVCIAGRPQA